MKLSRFSKLLHISIIAALAACLCAMEISAASLGVGTVNADGLRLRESAGTDSKILTTMNKGTALLVLGEAQNGWYPVETPEHQGYVSADFLDVSRSVEQELGYGLVEADGSVLNVRSGPGTGYDRVAQLKDGAVVEIVGFDAGWFKISFKGREGYVSSDYMHLTKNEPAASAPASASASSGSSAIGSGVSTSRGQDLVNYAATLLGKPYVYGGNGPNSFDCSGFTKYVYAHFGISINRTASAQLGNGRSVAKSELQPGDLVFFRNDGSSSAASHVGIYVGGDRYIHASSDTRQVEYNSLNTPAHIRKYVGARRIL